MMFAQLNAIDPALPTLIALLASAVPADWLGKRLPLCVVHGLTRRTAHTWDDALANQEVFRRVDQEPPVLVVYLGIHFVLEFGLRVFQQPAAG